MSHPWPRHLNSGGNLSDAGDAAFDQGLVSFAEDGICVTGFGAGDSCGHGGFLYCAAFHLLLGRVYDDKDVQERIVRRSK